VLPPDHREPDWTHPTDEYDWKNFISTGLSTMWLSFGIENELPLLRTRK